MDLEPLARLGAYEIETLLGEGGMGLVYRARDTTLQRTVAIKLLADTDAGTRERLLHEARAASALNHPHICTIHEVRTDADPPFLVMEYVAGSSLTAAIPPGGLLPPGSRADRSGLVALRRAVCGGLESENGPAVNVGQAPNVSYRPTYSVSTSSISVWYPIFRRFAPCETDRGRSDRPGSRSAVVRPRRAVGDPSGASRGTARPMPRACPRSQSAAPLAYATLSLRLARLALMMRIFSSSPDPLMAGISARRNRIAHGYGSIDFERIWRGTPEGIHQIWRLRTRRDVEARRQRASRRGLLDRTALLGFH